MTSQVTRIVLAVGLCAYGGTASAVNLPAPFEAQYQGSKFPLTAKAKISLSRAGDYYQYTLRGSVQAALYKWTEIYDCSVLQLRGSEFYPLEYVHRDNAIRSATFRPTSIGRAASRASRPEMGRNDT